MKYGTEAFERLVAYRDVETVLDVGSGEGDHAKALRVGGRRVTTISLRAPADIVDDYLQVEFPSRFDALWVCHVLEHQKNVNLFLRKCYRDLRVDGVLAITVPPLKQEVVGGHVTLWNAGLLLYNLVLAGFDCSKARVSGTYGYNISVIVRRRAAMLPVLGYDAGDIAKIAHYFPTDVVDGFNGNLPPINW